MASKVMLVLALAALAQATTYLTEDFSAGWEERWVKSEASKDGAESDIAKYDGKWTVTGSNNSHVLVASTANRHYGISKSLVQPFDFKTASKLVVQYEIRYENALQCGGSYVKLLSDQPGLDLKQLVDKTPYTILFGPDKCGGDSHLRFIYRFQNPTTSEYREVHANKIEDAYAQLFSEPKQTHLVTLIVNADNTFVMKIDQKQVAAGHLAAADDFAPALQPPKTIDDPTDSKPEDWVDEKQIEDPEDFKPDDWDESQPAEIDDEAATKPAEWDESAPATIPDPAAAKPEDWDDDEDGAWEPPVIDNPACATGCGPWVRPKIRNPLFRGKWRAKRIPNPAYKGEWAPKQIANPEYFEESAPFAKLDPINALGLELWTITDGISFSNFLITDSEAEAEALAASAWLPKRNAEESLSPKSGIMESIRSLVRQFKAAADDAPYLYILFTAIAGLPVILVLRCFSSSAEAAPAPAPAPETAAETGSAVAEDLADAANTADATPEPSASAEPPVPEPAADAATEATSEPVAEPEPEPAPAPKSKSKKKTDEPASASAPAPVPEPVPAPAAAEADVPAAAEPADTEAPAADTPTRASASAKKTKGKLKAST